MTARILWLVLFLASLFFVYRSAIKAIVVDEG